MSSGPHADTIGDTASDSRSPTGGNVFYEIPATLRDEIKELNSHIRRHLAGDLDAESLKGRRVPFGCYEHRASIRRLSGQRCKGMVLPVAVTHHPGAIVNAAQLFARCHAEAVLL